MTFTVLSVCTGNICRSPIAELVISRAFSREVGIVVESAGLGALVGSGAPDPTQMLAREHGLDVSHHVARQIDIEMIRQADLIIGMTRDHRRRLVEMLPSAMRRVFTLREFARVADAAEPGLSNALASEGAGTPAERMRIAVALAASLRGTVPPPENASEFDVIDPYRQSDETYRRSFDELVPAAVRASEYLLASTRVAQN